MLAATPIPGQTPARPLPRRRWTRMEYYDLVARGLLGPGAHVELIAGETLDEVASPLAAPEVSVEIAALLPRREE